jgi:hypothetical protein
VNCLKLHSLSFLLVLYTSIASQTTKGPVAKFSFNDRKDLDEVSGKKAKLIGASFTEDRFGNANHAAYIFGNEYSYINLGSYKALKPRVGTISLWVKIERDVWAGKGLMSNPVLITKSRAEEDFCEAYGIYYELRNHRYSIFFKTGYRDQQ